MYSVVFNNAKSIINLLFIDLMSKCIIIYFTKILDTADNKINCINKPKF